MPQRGGERIGNAAFSILYCSFVNKIRRDNLKDSKEKLFNVGKSIGLRLADEFFLETNPKTSMDMSEISKSVSTSFLPYYFSFCTNFSHNIISLKDFPILQYFKTDEEGLEIICGILHSVYNYLSKHKVRFEAVSGMNGPELVVRNESQKVDPIVTNFSDVSDICEEPWPEKA